MNNKCIFCKIVNKEIPAEIVFENDQILVFKDIEPKAPVHLLIIPKKHIDSLNDIDSDNGLVIQEIFSAIPEISKKMGIQDSGYRVIANCNKDGGQLVYHIHFHLIGGRPLNWPPG